MRPHSPHTPTRSAAERPEQAHAHQAPPGARRGACGAWPRCRSAAAGPGQAHAHQAPPDWRPSRGLRGLAAVPEGGGRARAGLEIDHSEPSGSRVAISRAGRRPPAHTAARPFKAGLRRPEHQRRHKQQHAARTARGRAGHAAAGPDGARNTSGQANRPYSPPPPGSGRPV